MKVYEATISYRLVCQGRRRRLDTPQDVLEYMAGAFDHAPMQESFYVVPLNGRIRPLCRTLLTLGTATCTLAHPREVFRAAILAGACAILCVHNHPSGDPTPSDADLKLTRKLRDAGIILGIELLDHVIIGTSEDDPQGLGYYSFRTGGYV